MPKPTALKLAVVMTGRTQKSIAAELGIDEIVFSRFVNGHHPDEATRQRIADHLGKTRAELWPHLEDVAA